MIPSPMSPKHPTTTWPSITGANPDHAQFYISRWEKIEEQGRDTFGEARLVDAMAPRNAKIMDAGAGTGRLSARLSDLGHQLTAVDIDPDLIAYGSKRFAGKNVDWHVGDLAIDSGDNAVPEGSFDIIFAAGNVMAFIPGDAHVDALKVLGKRLADDGRIVIGFGLNRGRSAREFAEDAQAAGLRVALAFATWDLRPFEEGSDFLVAVLEKN